MKTPELHKDIKEITGAIQFISETAYKIDQLYRDIESIKIVDPLNALSVNAIGQLKQKWLNVLMTDIYNNYYNADDGSGTVSDYKGDDFVLDLSKNNSGAGTWEEGWQFLGMDDKSGKAIVQKDNMKFWVEKDKVIQPENGKNESDCLVKTEKEKRFLNPYFYYAYGNTGKNEIKNHSGQLLRFYWNLTPQGAIQYMQKVTELFNKKAIRFHTKVVSDPEKYYRTDSGVLYIDQSQLKEALPLIITVYNTIRHTIKQTTPKFTKQIFPGLGFAEDPHNGLSFGISRSKIIAETLYDYYQEKRNSQQQLDEVLFASFEKEGILASKPYACLENINYYEQIFNTIN